MIFSSVLTVNWSRRLLLQSTTAKKNKSIDQWGLLKTSRKQSTPISFLSTIPTCSTIDDFFQLTYTMSPSSLVNTIKRAPWFSMVFSRTLVVFDTLVSEWEHTTLALGSPLLTRLGFYWRFWPHWNCKGKPVFIRIFFSLELDDVLLSLMRFLF